MTDQRLEKLKTLLKLTSEGLTMEEFTKAFKVVLDYIKKAKEDLALKIDAKTQTAIDDLTALEKQFQQVIENAKSESDNTLAGFKRKTIETINSLFIKSRVNERLQSAINEVDLKIRQVDVKMAGIKPLEPVDTDLIAKQASDFAITAIKPLIPSPIAFDEEISKAGDLIVKTVNSLPAENSWHIEDIYELRKELDELRAMKTRGTFGGGFNYSALTIHQVDAEIPVDTGDGLNFTINHTPSPTTSLKIYRNGQRLTVTEDYTFSGQTITLLVALVAGEILRCDYQI